MKALKCYVTREESPISHLHHEIKLHNAISGEVIKTFTTMESLTLYTYEHHIELPMRAHDGSFVHDDDERWIYRNSDGTLEHADDSLVLDAEICTNCGWIATADRIEHEGILKEEDEGGRMGYVCHKCNNHMFEMPTDDVIGALD